MRVAVYSTKPYDRRFLGEAAPDSWQIEYLELTLNAKTARFAAGFDAVCCFVNDVLDRAVLDQLAAATADTADPTNIVVGTAP